MIKDVTKKKEGFDGQQAIVIPRKILNTQCQNDAIIGQLYITDSGYYPKARYHYRERHHGADQHILIYCQEGTGAVTIKKNSFTVSAGEFFVVPIKTPHTYEADVNNPWTIYWIHFKGPLSDSLVDLVCRKTNGYKGFIKDQDRSIGLFKEMYHQLERGYSADNLTYSNLRLSHYIATMIYDDRYDAKGKLKHKDVIDNAIDYFSKNIGEMLTLENMASAVNLSASHFSFLFKKKTGFSPIEYFNHLKVQKASQYLLFTDLRVKEIALELGINDPYYFTRMFTKLMGLSPNKYREKKIH